MTIDIGNRLEPFWDRYLIERLEGAHLQLHAPTPREEVLRFDRPWEGAAVGYPTMLRDGQQYRLYYRGWPSTTVADTSSCCLAQSDDGIHFTRVPVNQHTRAGTRQNNIVLAGEGAHNFSPFIDTHPAALARQRYKAIASIGTKDDGRRGLGAFASADGVNWSLLQHEPVITQGAFRLAERRVLVRA